MQHDFSIVFDTENEFWQRVLEIFAANESYPKKKTKGRELHHKFPRSFSKKLGEEIDNSDENLISLSPADHFRVHYYYYLLANKGFRQPMALAFRMMARKCIKYITPDTVEEMVNDYEEAVEISRQYISQFNKGNKFSDEHCRKMSEAHKGKKRAPFTDETRRKMSEAKKGRTVSEETRRKMSEAHKGIPLTDECRRHMSEAAKKREVRKMQELNGEMSELI